MSEGNKGAGSVLLENPGAKMLIVYSPPASPLNEKCPAGSVIAAKSRWPDGLCSMMTDGDRRGRCLSRRDPSLYLAADVRAVDGWVRQSAPGLQDRGLIPLRCRLPRTGNSRGRGSGCPGGEIVMARATRNRRPPRAVDPDRAIISVPQNPRSPAQRPRTSPSGVSPCFRGRAIVPLNLWITLLTTSTPDTRSRRNCYTLDDLPKI